MYGSGCVGVSLANMGKHYGINTLFSWDSPHLPPPQNPPQKNIGLRYLVFYFGWRILATWPGKKRGGYEFRVTKDKMRNTLKLKNKIAHLTEFLS
jgi:hypothetical protein